MVLVLSINHTAYGLSVTPVDTNTVSRDDIIDFGEKFIKENIGRSYDSTWTEETCMDEIIETKDVDGNLNGIITNLTTNKNETGYVVIDAFSKDSMNVSEFGYDGKYYITDDNIINNVSLDNVINLGDRNYFTKKMMYYILLKLISQYK